MNRMTWAAGALAAGLMLASQAGAAVVDFEDVAPGTYGSEFHSGGLHFRGGIEIIPASDPVATGSSGQEALALLYPPQPFFSINGDAFYTSLQVNGAAGETLTILTVDFNNVENLQFTDTLVLDSDTSTFQTYAIPSPLGRAIKILISSDSGNFTVDNIVYDRPAEWGAVPEPASWAMMILGFGAVGAAARRRKVAVA